ncbi:MAG TPA: hypothetical protein VGK73_19530, partial [Polyangiaceae bacterium]
MTPPLPLFSSSAIAPMSSNSMRASVRFSSVVVQLTMPTVGIALLGSLSMVKVHAPGVPFPPEPPVP